jgi:LSD1 subclass zinc finger protein
MPAPQRNTDFQVHIAEKNEALPRVRCRTDEVGTGLLTGFPQVYPAYAGDVPVVVFTLRQVRGQVMMKNEALPVSDGRASRLCQKDYPVVVGKHPCDRWSKAHKPLQYSRFAQLCKCSFCPTVQQMEQINGKQIQTASTI